MSVAAPQRVSRGHLALIVLSILVIAAAVLLLLDVDPGTQTNAPFEELGTTDPRILGSDTPTQTSGGSPLPGRLSGGLPSPRADGSPDPDANKPHGDLKFEVKLVPDCSSQGLPMRAEISTTPGAAITLAVVYKDGQTYGQFGTFRANADGLLVYPWTVPASVPNGLGRFLAGADDQSLGTSSAGYWNFRIESPGRC